MSLPQRPPYRARRRTIRTLKISADSLKLGMIRGQSEPLHGQRPSLRAAGQKLMLKGSSPTAPIVHKRSALDMPPVEIPATVPTVQVQPRSQYSSRPVKTARPATDFLPVGTRDLTKFEAAFLELEAKSLIEISGELFPDDPLAIKLPPEVYKAALPPRLVYEVKPREGDDFREIPALEYSFDVSRKSARPFGRTARTPRRDLPNLLSFEPGAVSKMNVQAIGDARSTVLVKTADTMMKEKKSRARSDRNWSQQPKRGPTPFELAMGLKSSEEGTRPVD